MIALKTILNEILVEDKIASLSPQDVADKKLFGPVYHGTSSENWSKINDDGFKVITGTARSGGVSNGYEASDYYGGFPAPIHHLGFGVYFTTSKTIAKQFNHGTTKGLSTFFLDAPNLETINFGAPRTMMKWWIENGYDYRDTPQTKFGSGQTNLAAIHAERMRATLHLTETLKAKYDAVWFKGKGMHRLLDGDQVCIFDPKSIYRLDLKLSKKGEIGSKVRAAVNIDRYNRGEITVPMGTKGMIISRKDAEQFRKDYPMATWTGNSRYLYDIKWEKGGMMHQVLDDWVQLI